MLNRTAITVAISAMLAASLAACGGTSDSSDAADVQIQEAKSNLHRDMAPKAADEKVAELVSGNSAFGYDLYHQLASAPDHQGKNMFYSSFSISSALGMVYAGAKGNTETEMADVLHYTLPQAQLHAAVNKLDLDLNARAKAQNFQLNIANATWGQDGQHFEQDYLDLLAVNYGAGFNLLDFVSNAEGSRQTINRWVSQQTQGKIPNLLPQGTITPATRFVLTNAIYFKAEWASKFDPDNTSDGAFSKLDGSQITSKFMHQTGHYHYYDSDKFQAVELPYQGKDMSMLVMIPASGHYADFEKDLSAQSVAAVEDKMKDGPIVLTMPKFQFSAAYDGMADTLKDMGMHDAFGNADFSGITGDKSLSISAVVHKAFVAVNEKGTEAAAATGVVAIGSAGPGDDTVYINADKPFVFMIRDTKTGTVLFTGRVLDPSAE